MKIVQITAGEQPASAHKARIDIIERVLETARSKGWTGLVTYCEGSLEFHAEAIAAYTQRADAANDAAFMNQTDPGRLL